MGETEVMRQRGHPEQKLWEEGGEDRASNETLSAPPESSLLQGQRRKAYLVFVFMSDCDKMLFAPWQSQDSTVLSVRWATRQ